MGKSGKMKTSQTASGVPRKRQFQVQCLVHFQ